MTGVLLIEDEPSMRRMLRGAMAGNEYTLVEAGTGEEGLALAHEKNPDVILLDLGLPDIDGVVVTKRLREWTRVPIIVLSARGQDRDKIDALDAGADDYLTKPFSVPELFARMRAACRRRGEAAEPPPAVIRFEDISIDRERRVVTRRGEEVKLTPIEYKLLTTMAENDGRVLTHQYLLRQVWGLHSTTQKQYLHVYVGHLRNKLEDNPARPKFIVTEPGVGYRLRTGS